MSDNGPAPHGRQWTWTDAHEAPTGSVYEPMAMIERLLLEAFR
jgi:hypothetical protein